MKNILFLLLFIFCAACQSVPASPSASPSNDKQGGKTGKLKTPADYTPPAAKKVTHKTDNLTIDMYAVNFAQGNLVYCEVYSETKNFELKKAVYGQMVLSFTKKAWGYRMFLPIAPAEPAGQKSVILTYSTDGRTQNTTALFTITAANFPVSKTPLDLGKFSNRGTDTKPEVIAFIKESRKKKDEAFASRERDLIGNSFSHPRNMHYITSHFYAKRIYQNYRIEKGKKIRLKDTERVHRGLDLRGETGAPVYAMADGKVVLADFLYYEGNMVVIDHGNKLFSYYMHLNAINVSKGSMVKAGDLIGAVGSTGISTAAHLHVSLILNWVELNPLGLLSLPVRD
ncbi:MAG: M23 family metallopeptidase [Leptospirales bacterium]|nr:M23 family metallopeptidase [Leptospirales bacterium]